MTTKWAVPPDLWAGETVAVLGAGPDMTAELAESVRGCKTIAVNRAVKFAPWADMFVAIDPWPEFWDGMENFDGVKVVGVECAIDARYIGHLYERVALGEGHVIEFRNNGLMAIRIAYMAGARKILLLCFDPESYEARPANVEIGFYGLVQGLEQITAELRAKGIEVERVDSARAQPVSRKRK